MARPLMKSWVQPNKERMRGPAIVLPPEVRNLEIKNHMFQQLPKFYGLAMEYVMGFLNEIENFINNLPRCLATPWLYHLAPWQKPSFAADRRLLRHQASEDC